MVPDSATTEPQDYKELTAAEEHDIEDVLNGHDWKECTADQLTTRLESELEGLEAVCVRICHVFVNNDLDLIVGQHPRHSRK